MEEFGIEPTMMGILAFLVAGLIHIIKILIQNSKEKDKREFYFRIEKIKDMVRDEINKKKECEEEELEDN